LGREALLQRAPATKFQDLIVWQKSHAVVLAIYRLSGGFPRTESYGLTAQVRRAAVSVAANIAEGFKKRSRPDKVRFMNIAQASLEEVRYYLILASDLNYADTAGLLESVEEVSRMLERYQRTIQASASQIQCPDS
jgi:four helix bundle protein